MPSSAAYRRALKGANEGADRGAPELVPPPGAYLAIDPRIRGSIANEPAIGARGGPARPGRRFVAVLVFGPAPQDGAETSRTTAVPIPPPAHMAVTPMP